jgi:metal-responsive CopG/Arc/MetJ family transcriptional regulator
MAKGNPLLSVRLPADLNQLLDEKSAVTGESRSEVAIAALMSYLMPATPEDEVAQLKRRVERLEMKLAAL